MRVGECLTVALGRKNVEPAKCVARRCCDQRSLVLWPDNELDAVLLSMLVLADLERPLRTPFDRRNGSASVLVRLTIASNASCLLCRLV
jgi:hypothetical protein